MKQDVLQALGVHLHEASEGCDRKYGRDWDTAVSAQRPSVCISGEVSAIGSNLPSTLSVGTMRMDDHTASALLLFLTQEFQICHHPQALPTHGCQLQMTSHPGKGAHPRCPGFGASMTDTVSFLNNEKHHSIKSGNPGWGSSSIFFFN